MTFRKLPLTRPRVSIIVHGLAATKALTLPHLFLGHLTQVCQKNSHMTTMLGITQLQLLWWPSAKAAEVSHGLPRRSGKAETVLAGRWDQETEPPPACKGTCQASTGRKVTCAHGGSVSFESPPDLIFLLLVRRFIMPGRPRRKSGLGN